MLQRRTAFISLCTFHLAQIFFERTRGGTLLKILFKLKRKQSLEQTRRQIIGG
jgi:hypothetical protein